MVAERVVDLLEAVEVEQQKGNRPNVLARRGQSLFHSLLQQVAIRQIGQRIVGRLVA